MEVMEQLLLAGAEVSADMPKVVLQMVSQIAKDALEWKHGLQNMERIVVDFSRLKPQ